MLDRYGKAVLDERANPRHLAETARYARWEYDPGTGPGYVLSLAEDGARNSKGEERGMISRILRALRLVAPVPSTDGQG